MTGAMPHSRLLAVAMIAAMMAQSSLAAPVDISSQPLVTGAIKPVAPNIMFILDDSSSMNWEYIPDTLAQDSYNSTRDVQRPCFMYSGYNPLYYDPTATYTPPIQSINADGSANYYPAPSFTSAPDDGFNSGSAKINLNTSFRAYKTNSRSWPFPYIHTASPDTAQQAYYYGYSGTSPTTCNKDTLYTKVTIATASAQAQNFANWFSFYRTRINMFKSSAGAAFGTLDTKFRVGFTVISEPGTPANSPRFLPVSKFTATQKQTFFTDLYTAGCPPGQCATPSRDALAKAGRYFAGQFVSASIPDPVQYSCQRNYAVLVTDGYWNTGSPETSCNGSSSYGTCTVKGNASVGDVDGVNDYGLLGPKTSTPFVDTGKYQNSMSDIAMYYWGTDLRPGPAPSLGGLTEEGTYVDVSQNNVQPTTSDPATWQHMNTFGVALGVPGVLQFAPNYLQGGSADYNAILQGTKSWPDPQTASSASSVPARIDDLWHAAVNGRGQYFSVKTPTALESALGNVLSSIKVENGAGAAGQPSNLQPVNGDNFDYIAQYTSGNWTGDLQQRSIDLVTGAIQAAPGNWSATTLLQSMVAATTDTRTIYTFSASAANKLKTFVSANLTAEKTANDFQSSALNPGGALSQYGTFTSTQQTAATQDAMIGYIRGQTGFEMSPVNSVQLFRQRLGVLGDIVDVKPVYVKQPYFSYLDTGYAAFAAAQASRAGRVYAGANDGMVHAFDAATGAEQWAYIPSMLIPKLYKLADAAYATNHQFYADGQMASGDAYNGTAWKTILVGGLGAGGRGYYALDVTDPANPVALWEFGTAQDANVGYGYSTPIITKRASDGRWVVIVPSGYNNNEGGVGDGEARLYVLDAFTGVKLQEIIANGSVTDPNANGIGKIANWVDATLINNQTQYVYGGDLSGNLWRFDLTANSVQRLGYTPTAGAGQPITMTPQLGTVKDGAGIPHKAIYFGTGRYLGFSDLNTVTPSESTTPQTIYAVKDSGTDLGNLQSSGAKLVAQTLNAGSTPRTIASPASVDWATQNGWYMTLPVGERMTVDPQLQLGTFVIASNVPDTNYCTVGGTSWLYALDYKTGGPVSSAQNATNGELIVGTFSGNALTVGASLIQLPSGEVVALVSMSDTKVSTTPVPIAPAAGTTPHRLGWRELN